MIGDYGTFEDGIKLRDFHYSGRCSFECTRCGATWEECVPVELRDVDGKTTSVVISDKHSPCKKCKELDALADKLFERLVGPMSIRIAQRLRS